MLIHQTDADLQIIFIYATEDIRYDLFCKQKEQQIFLLECREGTLRNMYRFVDSVTINLNLLLCRTKTVCWFLPNYKLLPSYKQQAVGSRL